MTPSPDLQRIDEQRLERDIGYRVEFLCKMMDFTGRDVMLIQLAAAYRDTFVAELVDSIYSRLFSFDATKRHFLPRQHGYSGAIAPSLETLTLEHDLVAYRKQHMANYLVRLLTATFDGNMVQYLNWVGKIHTKKAGNPDIEIPLIQVNAMFGFLNNRILELVREMEFHDQDKDAIGRAFTKLLWIQADLFACHYINPDSV